MEDLSDASQVATGDASGAPGERLCAWCREPIRRRARRDAVHCSTRCRQAHHRFRRGVELRPATGEPLRLAYADPPYPGLSARYYSDHPDFGGEVDHAELVSRLTSTYDGWALSTSAAALPKVLALCPPGVRVAAWVRGERPNRRAVRPLNAWEPVIFWGGRPIRSAGDGRRVDVLIRRPRPRSTDPANVVGAKPADFCWWLFDLLGALPGDALDDLYPGSGGVSRAWAVYSSGGSARRVPRAPHDASCADPRRVPRSTDDASPLGEPTA